MVNLPLNLRPRLPRTGSEIFVSGSAIQCHRDRSNVDFDSFGTLEEFNPKAQRLFNPQATDIFEAGPVLEQLKNYLAQVDVKLSPEEQISGEIERILEREKSAPNIQKLIAEQVKMLKEVLPMDIKQMRESGKNAKPPLSQDEIEVHVQKTIAINNKIIAKLEEFSTGMKDKNPKEVQKKIAELIDEESKRVEGFEIRIKNRDWKDPSDYNNLFDSYGFSKMFDPRLRIISKLYDEGMPIFELAEKRAKYNLDPKKFSNIFNDYLPYRKSIQNNDKELKFYEGLVKLVQKRTIVYHAEAVNKGNLKATSAIDPSSSYLLAAHLVEITHNRTDLLIGLLGSRGTLFRMVLANELPNIDIDNEAIALGGYYQPDENLVAIKTTALNSRMINHELCHALEGSGRLNDCNGIFESMESVKDNNGVNLLERFKAARNELFKKSGNKDARPDERFSGLGAYTFKNDKEFLAETSAIFFTNPELLKKASEELYEVYKLYFRVDPIELKKAAK